MFDGISIWQLLIILAIVIVVFGTKRLSSVGSDVGKAIKSFKKAMNEDEETPARQDAEFSTADRQADTKTHSASSSSKE